MIKRAALNDSHLRRALVKAPLILVYFLAPLLIGLILSPSFANLVQTPEWLGVFGFSAFIAVLVYINGFLGTVLFGGFLFYFLNAIRMQNRWIYWFTGFAAGTVFNLFAPGYSTLIDMAREMPVVGEPNMAEIGFRSFPLFFGFCGLAVAWAFWREVAKGGEVIHAH